MSIDFKNNVKATKKQPKQQKLFAGGNCPEPYLGQFALEYVPI